MHVELPRQEKANEFKFRLLKLELSPLEQELESGVTSGKSDFHLIQLTRQLRWRLRQRSLSFSSRNHMGNCKTNKYGKKQEWKDNISEAEVKLQNVNKVI